MVVDEPLVVTSEPMTGFAPSTIAPDPILDGEALTNIEINDSVIPAHIEAPTETLIQEADIVQQAKDVGSKDTSQEDDGEPLDVRGKYAYTLSSEVETENNDNVEGDHSVPEGVTIVTSKVERTSQCNMRGSR